MENENRTDIKFGIVLAGGLSKGAYEIGCLRAIEERFGRDAISCISASSIGVPIAYSFAANKLDEAANLWHRLETESSKRFFATLVRDAEVQKAIRNLPAESDEEKMKVFTTLWNFKETKAEYVDMMGHPLATKRDYMTASIAIPVFNKGVQINDKIYFDGAFMDNIPVYPLQREALDFIFCIYFDPQRYTFENEAFDSKIIHLNDFPVRHRLTENLVFNPKQLEEMMTFGYEYTKKKLRQIFVSDKPEKILAAIAKEKRAHPGKTRTTFDTLLTSCNKIAKKFSKREIL